MPHANHRMVRGRGRLAVFTGATLAGDEAIVELPISQGADVDYGERCLVLLADDGGGLRGAAMLMTGAP